MGQIEGINTSVLTICSFLNDNLFLSQKTKNCNNFFEETEALASKIAELSSKSDVKLDLDLNSVDLILVFYDFVSTIPIAWLTLEWT